MKHAALVFVFVLVGLSFADPDLDPDDLVGYWTGAYIKNGSVLRVEARIERDDDGVLTWSERIPDWIVYDWFDAEAIATRDDGSIVVPSLYKGAELRYDHDRAEIIGACRQSDISLHLKRSIAPPAPPAIREIPIEFGDDVRLAGTLVLPEGDGPFTCIVMVHPRGCYDRSAALLRGRFFARHGYAAFAYDQRGMGESEGFCEQRTIEDLVVDVNAAIETVRSHECVDANGVGVLGVSAGAWVCQMAAGENNRSGAPLAFVITWIGPATSVIEQQRDSARALGKLLKLSEEDIELVLEHVDLQVNDSPNRMARFAAIEDRARAAGWLDSMFSPDDFPSDESGVEGLWLPRHRFDPTETLRTLTETPYLAVLGENDPIVPLDINRDRLLSLLSQAGNHRLEVRVIPGLGHDLSRYDETRRIDAEREYHAFERPDPRPFEAALEFLRTIDTVTLD